MKTTLFILAAVVGVTSVAAVGVNETISTSAKGGHESCMALGDTPDVWYYNSRSSHWYTCKDDRGELTPWTMLNAYRSGGTEGVHWKYTDNANDGDCLEHWKYYSSDGQTLIATIPGRTTTQSDSRRWCALPVYRPGGVEDKQWAYCACSWD